MVTRWIEGTARVWAADTGREVARLTHGDRVFDVAFSPDGRYVVSGSEDNTARVWEAASGREVARLTHDWVVTAVAFSPDGRYVVSGSEDTTARVWEAASGREVARMTHGDEVGTVAFSPDGRYVVSEGCDKWGENYRCIEVHLQETFSDVVKTDKTGLSKTAHTRWMISAFANFLPGSTIFRLA